MASVDALLTANLPVMKGGCCCSLKTCCKVQGCLTLVLTVVEMVLCVLYWSSPNMSCYWIANDWRMDYDCNGATVFVFMYALAYFTASVVLLAGIMQRQAPLLTPYMWLQFVHIVLLFAIYCLIIRVVWYPFTTLFITLPIMAISIYCLLCVHSLRAHFMSNACDMHNEQV